MKLVFGLILQIIIYGLAFGKSYYFISSPRILRAGETASVVVSLTDLREDEILTFEVQDNKGVILERAEQIISHNNGKGIIENVNFKIPQTLKNEAKLVLSGSGGINFAETLKIDVVSPKDTIFIQTDKPVYKPGNKVQFRVVVINKDLKPVKNEIVDVIYIKNPTDSRVAQWSNVTLKNGMVSLEMQLSKQPVLGTWQIGAVFKGSTETQEITVEKYVLPKYEVKIKQPSHLHVSKKIIPITICAKYTYGKSVEGSVKAKICLRSAQSYVMSRLKKHCQEIKKKINGCTDVEFKSPTEYLKNGKPPLYRHSIMRSKVHLQIHASVTEEVTSITLSNTAVTKPFQWEEFKIEIDAPKYYKPGFPVKANVIVTGSDGRPITGKTITVTVKSGTKKIFDRDVYIENGRYDLEFKTDLSSQDTCTIEVKAFSSVKKGIVGKRMHGPKRLISQPVLRKTASIQPWYSKSKTFIKISEVNYEKNDKQVDMILKLRQPRNLIKADVNFLAICKGKIKWADRQLIQTTTYTYTMPITNDMAPTCRLLVYFIRDDGEFVSDFKTLNIAYEFENKVSLTFMSNENQSAKPGDQIKLTLKASSGSSFALTAVDRSVQLLQETNDIKENQVLDVLNELDVGPSKKSPPRKNCPRSPSWGWYSWRRPHWGIRPVNRIDGTKALHESGLIYVTNAKVDLTECPKIRPIPYHQNRRFGWRSRSKGRLGLPAMRFNQAFAFQAVSKPRVLAMVKPDISNRITKPKIITKKKEPMKIRTEFPETWLWKNFDISQSGEETIEVTIPDTITTWYANGYALSPLYGIGVAKPTNIKAFQPFFVSLTLPYSVIRGEVVSIPATIFNYLEDCLVIELHLKRSSSFYVVGDSSKKFCVCGGKSNTFKFKIKPLNLGRIDITVLATSLNDNEKICKTYKTVDENTLTVDGLTKKLLVEPEGIKKEYATSLFFCPKQNEDGNYSERLKLDLPSPIVQGSVFAELSIVGDLMGPSIEGLDKLLAMPYGCGEQNMLKFAPNIYVMDYITVTNQVNEKIKEQAIEYMKSGYQRELTYKHKDGAYSAFGERDKEGSTWLTAFVLRVYSQAKRYIFIDDKDIEDSRKWLLSLQDSTTGCFKELGMIHHKEMKGGVTSGITMTAFVLNALLESGLNHKDMRILKAVSCIKKGISNVNDSYTASVLAYSLSLANDPEKTTLLQKLKDMEIRQGGFIYWEGEKKKTKDEHKTWHWASKLNPANIEMTAYALMSYISGRVPFGSRLDHFKIVKWLIKQRNPHGGFGSTQDTCVALQALAQYAAGAFTGTYNLGITVSNSATKFYETFAVTEANKLLVQKVQIPKVPIDLSVEATGNGCAVLQATMKYNIPTETDLPSFDLYHSIKQDHNSMSCRHTLKICGSFDDAGGSNMALIDVTMVSGFTPITDELDMMLQMSNAEFSFYEFEDGVLTFYFDKFDQSSKCITFNIEQENEVEERKPASIRLYDYYDTGNSATKIYNVGKCRTTNIIV